MGGRILPPNAVPAPPPRRDRRRSTPVRTVRAGTAPRAANSGGVNSVNLIGRLVEDPVPRSGPGGEPQCSMRLAVPRIGDAGLREPGLVYVEVVATGLRAHDVAREARAGVRVGVSGRLELDEWTEPGGERRTRYEVMADQLELLDGWVPPAEPAPPGPAPPG
jgi:single-strand DNA-binding protein